MNRWWEGGGKREREKHRIERPIIKLEGKCPQTPFCGFIVDSHCQWRPTTTKKSERRGWWSHPYRHQFYFPLYNAPYGSSPNSFYSVVHSLIVQTTTHEKWPTLLYHYHLSSHRHDPFYRPLASSPFKPLNSQSSYNIHAITQSSKTMKAIIPMTQQSSIYMVLLSFLPLVSWGPLIPFLVSTTN